MRQERRLNHLKQECQLLEKTEYKQMKIHGSLLVSDNLKTIYCDLPKVGSTLWKRALGIVSGRVTDADIMRGTTSEGRFAVNPSLLVHTPQYLTKAGIRNFNSYNTEEQQYRLMNYFKFLFVRDPFERLRSAYDDKIGPRGVRAYQRKVGFWFHLPTANITLKDFLDTQTKLALKEGPFQLNIHWMPCYTMCFPCDIHYDFIGKMETLYDDANYVLRQGWKTNWTSQEMFIASKGPTTHSANTSTEDRLAAAYQGVNRHVIAQVRNVYGPDFMLFSYNPFRML